MISKTAKSTAAVCSREQLNNNYGLTTDREKMIGNSFKLLLDIGLVRHLLESHHNITGMTYGVYDTDENNLIEVGLQDICVHYHRGNPICCPSCCDFAHIKAHLHNFHGDFLECRCKNGMIDIAIPIIIDGTHMVTLFTGHFFYDDALPDKEFFLTQAWALGFDPEGYLAALDDVPVFSREYVRKNVLFLRNMMNVLTVNGLNYYDRRGLQCLET
jgi:hypothetical protein